MRSSGVTAPVDEGIWAAIGNLAHIHGSVRRPLTILTIASVISGLAEAAAMIAFVRAIVEITAENDDAVNIAGFELDAAPGALLAMSLGLVAVATIGHLIIAKGTARLSFDVSNRARSMLIDAFTNAQWSYVAARRDGAFQEAMSPLTNRTQGATAQLVGGLSGAAIFLALAAAAIITSPAISIVMLAAVLVISAAGRGLIRVTHRRGTQDTRQTINLAEHTATTSAMGRELRQSHS